MVQEGMYLTKFWNFLAVFFESLLGVIKRISKNYKIFEISASGASSPLPSPPSDVEKYGYVKRHMNVLILFSVFGFCSLTLSAFRLYSQKVWMLPLYFLLAYTSIYFLISLWINLFSKDFDLNAHKALVREFKPRVWPSVDVFLPTCGESIDVLANTWRGVFDMKISYRGDLRVHCLDDAHCPAVRILAEKYGFHYYARPDKGWYKKAGNLRYGFARTDGDFIAIFDADFRPLHDFLDELLPYFYSNKNLGIVQSPQFFSSYENQNWLERGAGSVQELFYRVVQVSRQTHKGAICVGSNAIYRRAALNDIGGTALIEHSEDVHTGFELRMKDWLLLYVPLVLAKGLCPSELKAFFKQQYRWCMGSMSLLLSKKFWKTNLPWHSRICFLSGFMYYIHTALYAVLTPVVPLILLYLLPEQIRVANYLLIYPSVLYMHIVFPLWHRKTYGIEAASVRLIYGWAHFLALCDIIFNTAMEWQPTGAISDKKDRSFFLFRWGVVTFNLFPALLWVVAACFYMITWSLIDFLPIFILGIYYLCLVLKIVLYKQASAAVDIDIRGAIGDPDLLKVAFTKKMWLAGSNRPVRRKISAQSIHNAHQERMKRHDDNGADIHLPWLPSPKKCSFAYSQNQIPNVATSSRRYVPELSSYPNHSLLG